MAETWFTQNADNTQFTGLVYSNDGYLVAKIRYDSNPEAKERNCNWIAATPKMLDTLEQVERLIKEALPKFNWGASALDANAIKLLNEVPLQVRDAIAAAGGKAAP